MATLENRPNVALVVLDFQTGVVAEAHERDAVVANVARLVAKARAAQVPVVWVQHEDDEHLAHGSAAWQIVAELDPADAEAHVEKRYADAFDETTLESVLAGLGVGRLVIGGRADGRVHPLDPPRRRRPGLRRDARHRRPHDRGPDPVGGAAARPGHRAHEPVLGQPPCAGAHGGRRPDRRRRLRRRGGLRL